MLSHFILDLLRSSYIAERSLADSIASDLSLCLTFLYAFYLFFFFCKMSLSIQFLSFSTLTDEVYIYNKDKNCYKTSSHKSKVKYFCVEAFLWSLSSAFLLKKFMRIMIE